MNTTLNIAVALRLALVAACALTLAGCNESSSSTSSGGSSGAAPTSSAWRLASMPDGAVNVRQAKDTASEGDTVAIRGFIGGRKDALATDTATFVMIDTEVHNPCVEGGEDHCPTPWDYCCTPLEDRQANMATVQLVDETGAPMEFDLSAQGISPLDEVVVVGTVAARPSPQVLTIRATGLHRVGQ